MNIDCIAVAGMGLIGGSLAKALKIKAGIRKIIGIDPDESQLKEALEAGVIDAGFSAAGSYLGECGMVIICAPVSVCAELVIKVSEFTKPECVITDTASIKVDILKKVEKSGRNIRFVGGHPMAGSERSGYAYSREDMFENAYYLIMDSDADKDAVSSVGKMAESIGAIPIVTDADSHDSAVAVVSHVPHITAAALVNLLDSVKSNELSRQIAAGGFRDITRIASSQPALWKDITLNNKDAVIDGIDRLIDILDEARNNINRLKGNDIEEFFYRAKTARDIMSGEREGLLPRKYQIVIQVPDKPGVIAHIATILGDNGINIRNINVAHSREDVGGVLVVELYSLDGRNSALEILQIEGYSVACID